MVKDNTLANILNFHKFNDVDVEVIINTVIKIKEDNDIYNIVQLSDAMEFITIEFYETYEEFTIKAINTKIGYLSEKLLTRETKEITWLTGKGTPGKAVDLSFVSDDSEPIQHKSLQRAELDYRLNQAVLAKITKIQATQTKVINTCEYELYLYISNIQI